MSLRNLVPALALLASLPPLSAAPVLETGTINGAEFRIDIPETWSGVLVMYCHGYSPIPGKFNTNPPNPLVSALLKEGYAVAQSGYAAGGWAIQEAMQDTEALRRHFVAKHGKPKETYVMGHSMGGFLTMLHMERMSNVYDGGLALCGPLQSASKFIEDRTFGLRVVFDHYFPGVLPSPAKVPADFATSKELNLMLEETLNSKPDAAARVRQWSGIRNNKELAATLAFFTYILKEIQERTGGNPFDNRSIIYDGSGDDDALNDGVTRYAADPRAADYLRTWGTPTGRLFRPMLHIHTTYDPLIPPSIPNAYVELAENAGSAQLFVQQYVKRPGHCTFTPEETVTGFNAMRSWAQGGPAPQGGTVR